ncbi:MAG TPA: hypothetical protein VF638_00820 [Sphingomonas sp.]|jgi:hypothetical protein
MKRLDFRNPETIKKAANFPHYGEAMALIRSIDPLWKLDTTVDHPWFVILSRETHFCDCSECTLSEIERKKIAVDAPDTAAAEVEALNSLDNFDATYDWDVDGVYPADTLGVCFPDWIYETEGEA